MMGGFESCYTLNEHYRRLDLLCDTQHDIKCREDYKLLKEIGVFTVRESLAWHQIDKGIGIYDFSRFIPMMQIAQEEGMEVIWSLNHFDFPEDLDPFSDVIMERFATYAVAAIQTIRQYHTGTIYLIPFNEISFISWISGYMGHWYPFAKRKGWELKLQLVKATIAAMKAMREIDIDVKFIHTDPIMRRLAPVDASLEMIEYVEDFAEVVYQSWDMIGGRLMPELGDKPEYLDFVGLNYYITNQDVVKEMRDDGVVETNNLAIEAPERIGFDEIMQQAYQRYNKPIIITETGCFGALREPWWRMMLRDVDAALEKGIPLYGVCAYPIIDRPDWSGGHLTNSGFWDFANEDETCYRIPHEEVLNLIREYALKHNLVKNE